MTLLLEISPCLSTSQGKEQNPPQAYTRPGVTLLPSLSFFHAPTVLPMLSFHFLLYDMHHYLIYHIIYLFISYSRFYNFFFSFCLFPLECMLHRDRDFCLFFCFTDKSLYSQAQCKHTMNTGYMNE